MRDLVELLNQALSIEYEFVVHYPRLAMSLEDRQLAQFLSRFGAASVSHANIVAGFIWEMGGSPSWNLAPSPSEMPDIASFLEDQLERERRAADIYRDAAALAQDKHMRRRLSRLRQVEIRHARMIEKALLGRT
jgi:rubrerythrin